MRKIIARLYRYLTLHRWNIGFVEYDDFEGVISKDKLDIKWMKHGYKDRWFADPFFLNITEDVYDILVEEYFDKIGRGRISRLHVDRHTKKLKKMEVILELSSHLSFPAILRHQGKIYIYPENSVNKKLLFYEFDPEHNSLTPTEFVLYYPLTDAIYFELDKYYILSTQIPYQNGSELYIYSSLSWNGIYKFDKSIQFADCVARNAGDLFNYKGKLIRPAQDCNKVYGKGVVLQELHFDNCTFSFQELKRFYSHSWKYNLGMHTFNVLPNVIVVDGRGYRKPIIGRLLEFIRNYMYI